MLHDVASAAQCGVCFRYRLCAETLQAWAEAWLRDLANGLLDLRQLCPFGAKDKRPADPPENFRDLMTAIDLIDRDKGDAELEREQ
jgi:hypothetical protein